MIFRYLTPLSLIAPLSLFAISITPPNMHRDPKVIYGTDDRTQVISTEAHQNIQKGFNASVAIFHRSHLKENENGDFQIIGDSWLKKLNMCEDEPFVDEPTAANCSGVLIGPNLVLTASHCVIGRPKDFCKHYRFAFGYRHDRDIIPGQDVYRCSTVLENEYSRAKGIDWALISLDREVDDIDSVEVTANPQVFEKDTLTMIGYPAGLPRKVTENGTIREINDYYIKSNFDSFSGNSGSPIFNNRTGELIGLLIRGEDDYQYDKKMACLRPKKCKEFECTGEDIVKLSSMAKLGPYLNIQFQ